MQEAKRHLKAVGLGQPFLGILVHLMQDVIELIKCTLGLDLSLFPTLSVPLFADMQEFAGSLYHITYEQFAEKYSDYSI